MLPGTSSKTNFQSTALRYSASQVHNRNKVYCCHVEFRRNLVWKLSSPVFPYDPPRYSCSSYIQPTYVPSSYHAFFNECSRRLHALFRCFETYLLLGYSFVFTEKQKMNAREPRVWKSKNCRFALGRFTRCMFVLVQAYFSAYSEILSELLLKRVYTYLNFWKFPLCLSFAPVRGSE